MKRFKKWLDIKENASTMNAGFSESPALMTQLAKLDEKLKLIYDLQHDDQNASLHIMEKIDKLEEAIYYIMEKIDVHAIPRIEDLNRRRMQSG